MAMLFLQIQRPGQGGLGVVGRHPDGVGDLLGLGVQADHVRGEGAERDPGRDGRRGAVGLLQFAVGGLDRCGQGVDDLVGEVGGLAGGGAAQLEQGGVPGRPGGLGCGFGGLSDRPPESKVMPLPARTSVRVALG